MKVTVSGATGRVGRHLVAALKARGDEVTALSRDADKASDLLGVEAVAWNLLEEAVPSQALAGRDAIVHLAGEDVGQRWSAEVKARILDSREKGTRNLVHSIFDTKPRPKALICASASGYYGARGDEPVDESGAPGDDWLAEVCVRWERQVETAKIGTRTVIVRTGIVLDAGGGALAKMLPPFKAGIGGPIGSGRQYMPWIHRDDLVGLYLAAIDDADFAGPINASAPEPVTNKQFAKALGRALNRPAVAPVPGFTIKVMFGEMSQIVLKGVRMVPGRAAELGYEFRHPDLDEALRDTLDDE
ncbi:MAG: TIGR01777 family oxidoreductase [Solirubrobacteraceae bacterium]|nr:TIGR01777 family oxidoreductase [Solirubrobacteraceae bacterium]